MSTLYIHTPGTRLHREGTRIIAKLAGEEVATVPIEWLDLVVVQGACELTSACTSSCLHHGIPVAYLDDSGNYLGRLEPLSPRMASLQRAQFAFAEDPARCLDTARVVVTAKLSNSRVALRRWGSGDEQDALARLVTQAREAPSLDVLRGYEGAGAALYFGAFGQLVDASWGFGGRSMRPATDPLNAVLNYAYTLLHIRLRGAIAATGLNPYLGFFHADREGHAALASDLQEEWRIAIVDRLVVEQLRLGTLVPHDITLDPKGGYRLGAPMRRTLIQAWEARLEQHVTLPSVDTALPMRVALFQQALHFARHVRDPASEPYQPVALR